MGFMAYKTLWVIWCQILFINIYQIYRIWLSWVLWHINQCRLSNVKSSLYIYIEYKWFGLVGFYGISTILGYLIPNTLYIYIYIYIYIYVWWVGFYGIWTLFGYLMPNPPYTYVLNIYDLFWLGLWHINRCMLFNAKFSLYIYINYIWFSLVGFYGISTIVGYLMPNHVYTYNLDIYTFCKDIWLITFLNNPELFFVHS